MSGASIPYHLRPHKSVDRRLFFDLLERFQRWKSLKNAAYISMGAFPLEDHRLAHRLLGITNLIAFDRDESVVARQIFNKPVSSCHCICKSSGEIVDDLDRVLNDCGIQNPEQLIIWLDYTDPKELGVQIREFQSLLDKIKEGDFVRVTVNANPKELTPPTGTGAVLATKTMRNQFDQLKSQIGEYLPSSASPSDMTPEGLSVLLSQAFGASALKALPISGNYNFSPLSLVRYADTTQMLSISGTIIHKRKERQVKQRIDMDSWPFASTHWNDVKKLVVPSLTLREKLYLERGVAEKNEKELIDELGFSMAGEIDMKSFISSYKNYYRFYPIMLPTET